MATIPSANTSAPNADARITSARIAPPSRDVRSMAAPNSGPSSIAGSRSASSTAVAPHAEPIRSYASTQQRDVARAGAERALQMGEEEPAGPPLALPHVLESLHRIGSIGRRGKVAVKRSRFTAR